MHVFGEALSHSFQKTLTISSLPDFSLQGLTTTTVLEKSLEVKSTGS